MPLFRFHCFSIYACALLALFAQSAGSAEPEAIFREKVAPVFQTRCVTCHNDDAREGKLSLATRKSALVGGESGEILVPGNPDGSYLLDLITPSRGKAEMPKDGKPLSAQEVAAVRQWIKAGAKWPDELKLSPPAVDDLDWWSLKPIKKPDLPVLSSADREWAKTPIDVFILKRLRDAHLSPSSEADRRTLIRRLSYDLTGLPPEPHEVDAFLKDQDPLAYENLVDRLLASPHYGEHWARHWLDVVHYADTHGYDKDKPRRNAWPYRDYVIRALNEDKPYGRFLQEQIAGDVLWPGTRDGIVATGFLAAGPWDFIGHVEVPESKIDGQVARHLDRDDMVTTTMNTFASQTAQCARCHNHKFDPIRMEDYYSLQAVFAAIDRADRELPLSDEVAARKAELQKRQRELESKQTQIGEEIKRIAGPRLQLLDQELAKLNRGKILPHRAEFGYHSAISPKQAATKWVQIDLGEPVEWESIVLVGCHDNFNNIGAGFGFPLRYKIEASNDPEFRKAVKVIADSGQTDIKNPSTEPQCFSNEERAKARYLRITATKLAPRKNDYIFALGEVFVFDAAGENLALNENVTSLDSIEAPVRWQRKNLVDGSFYGRRENHNLPQVARLQIARNEILERAGTMKLREQQAAIQKQFLEVDAQINNLPKAEVAYAAATQFNPQGQFKPTGGKPRSVTLLARGDVKKPGKPTPPGTAPLIPGVPAKFSLAKDHSEGDRRKALADWLVRKDNPLTWRSIVNRVWLYHFGRGLVDSPNDFGRGGQLPSHPELLDWLAADFRDGGQSLKRLHRQICLSATYRQSSAPNPKYLSLDANNRLLWRMTRRRLTAEEIRDSVLSVAGRLKQEMGGPGFQDFLIEKPQHSPHYEYDKSTPMDPRVHRRAIYRFIVRSQPQPMLTVLDCADPARSVPKRDETLTPLQSLSLLNNAFMVEMAAAFAKRLEKEHTDQNTQTEHAVHLPLGRSATQEELRDLTKFREQFGFPATCRLLLNLNEFLFVD